MRSWALLFTHIFYFLNSRLFSFWKGNTEFNGHKESATKNHSVFCFVMGITSFTWSLLVLYTLNNSACLEGHTQPPVLTEEATAHGKFYSHSEHGKTQAESLGHCFWEVLLRKLHHVDVESLKKINQKSATTEWFNEDSCALNPTLKGNPKNLKEMYSTGTLEAVEWWPKVGNAIVLWEHNSCTCLMSLLFHLILFLKNPSLRSLSLEKYWFPAGSCSFHSNGCMYNLVLNFSH